MKKLLKKSEFMLLVTAAAFLFFVSCKKEVIPSSKDLGASSMNAATKPVTRNSLFIPNYITSSSFTLTAAPGTQKIGTSTASLWMYNGTMPGPTIVATKGDNISVTFKNSLSEYSIIHWHGMLVNTANDGGPMAVIPPNTSYNYNFPVLNRAALNWYHPHPHMVTGKQVYNGLAGAFIIRDMEEEALGLPSGAYEIPLVLRDMTFDKSGNPVYSPTGGGYFGKVPLVNGTRDPYLDVNKAVYRFRVLAGSTSRLFKLALSNGAPMVLIGNDGGLLANSSNQQNIEMCPGERIDILVDFRSFTTGTKIMLRDLNAPFDLLEFRVTSLSETYSKPLTTSSNIVNLVNPDTTRFFSFDGMSKINGKEYDMDKMEFTVPFGRTEMWIFKTNGNGPHPIHIHGASFQVVSRTGGRAQLFPWESGWKDVVLVNDFETVNVLIRFDTYRGKYVMHCHKLEHEDNGMMMNFEVK